MPVTSLRKACVRPSEVAKVRAAPGLAQLSRAGFGDSLLIGNGNGNGNSNSNSNSNTAFMECVHTARRVCRQAADSVILAGFSPNSHESCPPMEIQPILNTIKDLTERSLSIRGYL
jgi:hypothetical protein